MHSTLNILDAATLLGYAAMLIGIAIYHSRKIHARDDFYLAGRSMSRWPIAMSMYVALFSTNTFVGAVGWVNRPDGTMWIGLQNIGIILAVPFVVHLFPGIFFRLRLTTAYEYLEKRFDYKVRATAGAFFIGSRVMWMATMLYAGGLVISQLLGWTPDRGVPHGQSWAIALLGVLGMFFGLSGGMRSVIWTDVAQFFVLFGSVGAMLWLAFASCGGVAAVFSTAWDAGKFYPPEVFSLTADLSIVSGISLGLIGMLASAGTDQVILQTYLTAKSEREAKGSLWFNGLFLKPLSLVFPLLGVIIFVYFKLHPKVAQLMRTPDDALPVYILNVLPAGARGMAVSALMSALLTSLAGGMAALSACVQVDYVQRHMQRELSDSANVRLGRFLTFAWGILIVCASLLVTRLGQKNNIIQILNIVMYPFAGVLLGVFLLGLLTRRANAPGTLAGAAVGFLATIAAPVSGPLLAFLAEAGVSVPAGLAPFAADLRRVSNFYYGAFGVVATFACGLAVSCRFPRPTADKLAGLTHRTPPVQRAAGHLR